MICKYDAVRTPFGMTSTARASQVYGGSAWDALKERYRVEHDEARDSYIAAGGELGQAIYVVTAETPDYDGLIAEWRSEIIVPAKV